MGVLPSYLDYNALAHTTEGFTAGSVVLVLYSLNNVYPKCWLKPG